MIQQQEEQPVRISINDLIYAQQKDLGKRMDRLEQRMDRLEQRMDKQDEKIDRLADKIDALHNEIKASTGHISIANISTVGIALAVIYSVLR
ncbi:MAG: hypothetical protein IJG33_02145 [Selenomonadaceae bacterium]|nr:hypothetical protein [Selenomonadaceae bacterium]MBQ6759375.1 hypothetical protein [Selenomonadaceae bacterium]MBR0102949.1 hypothetical protein [Selenomonadaceae bacterium]MBR6711579.1 hypothetical protein [Selenomonadaceae bacterium]